MPNVIQLAVASAAGFLLTACAVTPAPISSPAFPTPAPSAPFPRPDKPNIAPRFVTEGGRLQCVPFARDVSGIGLFGDANTWWQKAEGVYPRSRIPSVGAVIVIRTFDDNSRGHVAVVSQILSDREVLVDHANWHGREEVTVNVPVRDVSEQNDWSSVNVWWLDTNSWGTKDYIVDGFIHPR